MRALLAALLVLATAVGAAAQSPLVAELRAWEARYHEEPGRLDRLYQGLTEAVKTDSHIDNYLALAQICFMWGDVRARSVEEKLEAYDRGRQAAKRVVELAPRNAWGHFWHATNAGRWGQTKGVMRSLFLVPTVKEGMRTALELDPKLVGAYSLAGSVYAEVPGLFGGDLDKSEEMFRKGIELDPRYTGLRVGLAKTLIKKKRLDEARRELRAVLDEKAPRNPADWTVKDSRQARELLDSLEERR
ncbi:MAG: tetratricopeptide repeat protein [Candidatus Rokubacteria bacterium]|nr:tetratricopeptide repeat protein [Candidatus Rokubacteria bacterium]